MRRLAYDSAAARGAVSLHATGRFDPAHCTLQVRAETTKTRRERVVPHSVSTGVLLVDYLRHRGTLSRARGPLFLFESRRNRAERLTLGSSFAIPRHSMRHVTRKAKVPCL